MNDSISYDELEDAYLAASSSGSAPDLMVSTLDCAANTRMKAAGESYATARQWIVEHAELRNVDGFDDGPLYALTVKGSTLLMYP